MLRYTKKNYFKICGFVYGALVIFGGCSDSATQEESKIEDNLTWTTGEPGESEDENLSLAAQGSNSVDFGVLRVIAFPVDTPKLVWQYLLDDKARLSKKYAGVSRAVQYS